MEEWRLTSEEMTELITKGWSVNDAQKAKRLAYIESGRVILNPDALEDLYEALEGLAPCMRLVPGGETPYEWAVSERAMIAVRKALLKAEVKDV